MSLENFEALINEFCVNVGLEDPQKIIDGGSVMINDVECAMSYGEEAFPEKLFIYFDFGELPENREAEACLALLRVNHNHSNGGTQTFGSLAEEKRIILTCQVDVNTTPADVLIDYMSAIAETALEWRNTYFLEEETSAEKTDTPRSNIPHFVESRMDR